MNTMSSSSLGIESNVQIRLCDKKTGAILQERNLHNKANYTMVQGLLRFLQGSFTGSQRNPSQHLGKQSAWQVVPCSVLAGDGGLTVEDNIFVSCDALEAPDFYDTSLIRPIDDGTYIDTVTNARYLTPADNAASYFQAQFSETALVKDPSTGEYYDNTYKVRRIWRPYDINPVEEERQGSLITEVGLSSGLLSEGGRLLARVSLNSLTDEDGNSIFSVDGYPDSSRAKIPEAAPIFKTDKEFLVVTWRIAIISIGMNDAVGSLVDMGSI